MYINSLDKNQNKKHTFFIIPVFLFENVVYLLNLLPIYSIFILTRPLVFFPLGNNVCPGNDGDSDDISFNSIDRSVSDDMIISILKP